MSTDYRNNVFTMFLPRYHYYPKNFLLESKTSFHKTTTRQNSLSYIGPSLWNKVLVSLEKLAAQILLSTV